MVQWLRFCASNARGVGSIPDWETKIPHATVWTKLENFMESEKSQSQKTAECTIPFL